MEGQFVGVLKEADARVKVADLCRKHGIFGRGFYVWPSCYGGMDKSEARRLRQMDKENQRLKRLVAKQALDIQVLKDLLGKSEFAHATPRSRAAGDRCARLLGAPGV
jgi:putative transposase